MARKKQTTRKSTRKEKVVTTGRVKCPGCQWTLLLTTLHQAQDEVILHYQQVHGLAPVRQVEDSGDEVAEDISTREVINLASNLLRRPSFKPSRWIEQKYKPLYLSR